MGPNSRRASIQLDTALIRSTVSSVVRCRELVYLEALVSHRLVSAANAGDDPLVADRTAPDVWETFELVKNSDGTIALRSLANGKFVTAAVDRGGQLIARGITVQEWEKFRRVDLGNGRIALKAVVNGKFVSALQDDGGRLVADRSQASEWEQFRFVSTKSKGKWIQEAFLRLFSGA